jgi:polyisoprenoid-binding protein YceI
MSKISSVFAAGLMAAAVVGCKGSDTTKAEVTEARTAPAQAANAAAMTYNFAAPDSKLEFVGAKVTGKHDGGFDKFSGTVNVVDGDVARSTVTVDVDMTSLRSDVPKLTGHLKSADFFDVEKFPKARFESTSIKSGGAAGATHTVTGNLDLHGVKKSITFPATIRVAGDTATVNAEFSLNRKDFGIVYPGMPDDLIRDDVAVKLTIAAKKAQS